jgi:hypothetical protein
MRPSDCTAAARRFGLILVLMAAVTLAGSVTGAHAQGPIPEGLTMAESYSPGVGKPVGRVGLVQGKAVIRHDGEPDIGYQAVTDLPLYKGDTVATGPDGRVRFELNDGSIMTLTNNSSLVINEMVYEPEAESRSSFLGMTVGKARFWVKELTGFGRSEVKVKTQTAIVGVRGSDFVVLSRTDRTEVIALEGTEVEVVSLVGADVSPTVVRDFQRTIVLEGELPSALETLPLNEIEAIKDDFTIDPDKVARKQWLEDDNRLMESVRVTAEPVRLEGMPTAGLAEVRLPDPTAPADVVDVEIENMVIDLQREIVDDTVALPPEPDGLPPFPDIPPE